MEKAKETPKADLVKVPFEIGEGKVHTHAGKLYGEGDVITLRKNQAEKLQAKEVGEIKGSKNNE